MDRQPTDDQLRAIVRGENIEPGGTNIPLIQAMARELLELRGKAVVIDKWPEPFSLK